MRALGFLLLATAGAQAQPADTLRLADVRAAAAAQDPRSVQPALLDEASRLRLANLRAERLPQFVLLGQATVQNDVASIPLQLPGVEVPRPPHEQFRVQVEAEQVLFDGGRLARRADIERARLAEGRAGVQVTMHSLREAATDAFFGALIALSRARALELTVQDLVAQLNLLRSRADQGAALQAEVAALEASIIVTAQQFDEAEADRQVSLGVLAMLTGMEIQSHEHLAVPGAELAILDGDAPADSVGRPEFARFASARDRSLAEARLARAGAMPDLRLFGQAGIGRPSPFAPFEDTTDPFALVGLRLRWNVVDWGRAGRDAQAARVQASLVETEADAFARGLERAVVSDRADIARLSAAAPWDDRAVSLREEVLRVARRQLEEGVLLAMDYVDRLTDLQNARLIRERHRIELAYARTHLLSTLGRFPGEEPPDYVHP